MFDQRRMKKLMKQAGVKMDEIEAEEVVIKTPDEEMVFVNPDVSVISAGGQKTFQVMGKYTTKRRKFISDEDVKMVTEKAGCTEKAARKALQETDGDIAKAILKLSE